MNAPPKKEIQRLSMISMEGFDAYLARKPIKNINVRIDRQGNVKVSAPLKCSLELIRRFLLEKHDWIAAHRKRMLTHSTSVTPLLDSGEQHLFLGQSYALMVHETSKQQRITLEGNHICCYVKAGATTDTKQALLHNWHRQQMKALLPALISKWEAIIGVQVHQWGIKAMKTRWGTCNPTKKRIWLSLHLIQKPVICLEYVLVHELVHLLEASHNKRFYALMSQFMPAWKESRNLLK